MADTVVAFPLYGVSSGATVPIKAVDLGGGVYALATSGTAGGGATIAHTTNLIKGDNAGNGADSGIDPAEVLASDIWAFDESGNLTVVDSANIGNSVNAGCPTQIFAATLIQSGGWFDSVSGLKVGGTQVVVARQAPISDPSNATVGSGTDLIDLSGLNTILGNYYTTQLAILNAMRAHGLIG